LSKSASGSANAALIALKRSSFARCSCDATSDVAAHVLGRVELRLLLQVADARPLVRPRLALELLVDAGHDAQQRALARAVGAEHADLRARVEREPDVVEDDPAGRDHLAQGPSSRK
jgi:hypothetical protein